MRQPHFGVSFVSCLILRCECYMPQKPQSRVTFVTFRFGSIDVFHAFFYSVYCVYRSEPDRDASVATKLSEIVPETPITQRLRGFKEKQVGTLGNACGVAPQKVQARDGAPV